MGDLPKWRDGRVVMGDLPRQKNTTKWRLRWGPCGLSFVFVWSSFLLFGFVLLLTFILICSYALILYIFIHALYKIISCIIHIWGELYWEKFRLSGGLAAYLMTFSQGLSLCKPQLFAESLDW